MRESEIEALLVRAVQERGGLCWKFVSPGNVGVPDRIVVSPSGRVVFVELKTDTGRLSSIQHYQQEQLRRRGAEVHTLYGLDAVRKFVREVMQDEVRTP